jgi:feruloyl esterase
MIERLLRCGILLGVALPAATGWAQSCENLVKLSSPTVSISIADAPMKDSVCRVVAMLKPTPDSDIGVEVWLPVANWNGKFLAVGSGGWGGTIATAALADGVRRGYAVAATDDGHKGGSASFAMGHPEKLIDFAWRAEHEMTVEAKLLIKAFYGRDPKYSYWNGCSGGGREGLLQAARYPEEFDGIIAGDPANIRRNAWALWLANGTFKDPAAYIPPAKYPMIHQAVLNACDAKDGLKDGLIEDPQSCHPDFKQLECKHGDGPDCLTTRQVRTAETMVSPAKTPSGVVLFPRLEPGTEMRWARLAGGPEPAELFLDEFRYVVYQDSKWDWKSFDLERDAAKAHAVDKGVDELDPNLAAFAKHGKLLMYHGWADQQVAPGSSVKFFEAARQAGGSADWMRLFMVPGMGHCSGGEGPDTFDKLGTLEQWVEQGKAPEEIVASHKTDGKVDRTRPLCPYPQVARYKGTGSVDEAANFVCAAK